MKKVLVSLLLIVVYPTVAQDYEYKIKENKINKHASDLSLVVNPVFTNLSENNTVGGYGADITFRLNTIMSFRGNYSGSYFNIEPNQISERDGVYNGISSGELKPFQYFHGELSLYLFTKVFEGSSKITLPSEVRNGEKQRYQLELSKVDKMQQVGFRFGGGKFQNQLKEKGFEFFGVDLGKPISDISAISDLDNSLSDNYTTIEYDLVSAGLTYEKVNHLVVEVENGIGEKSNRSQWMVYGDFLYGLNMNIGDILIAENVLNVKEEKVYELNKYTRIQEFGYRLGFEHNVTSKVGWSCGIELGSRPGTGSIGQRTYVSAKVGVSLNFKTIKY